jgi:hypothetical protein
MRTSVRAPVKVEAGRRGPGALEWWALYAGGVLGPGAVVMALVPFERLGPVALLRAMWKANRQRQVRFPPSPLLYSVVTDGWTLAPPLLHECRIPEQRAVMDVSYSCCRCGRRNPSPWEKRERVSSWCRPRRCPARHKGLHAQALGQRRHAHGDPRRGGVSSAPGGLKPP